MPSCTKCKRFPTLWEIVDLEDVQMDILPLLTALDAAKLVITRKFLLDLKYLVGTPVTWMEEENATKTVKTEEAHHFFAENQVFLVTKYIVRCIRIFFCPPLPTEINIIDFIYRFDNINNNWN